MKKIIIFSFICMSFVLYYFEIIILIKFFFLVTLYNYYKNKCERFLLKKIGSTEIISMILGDINV